MPKITMKMIAKEAGVSISAVSYVLNHNEANRISEPTAEKIRQIANLYDYHIDANARSLATGKTNEIGIYWRISSTHLGSNSLYLYFLRKLQSALVKMGYSTVLLPRHISDSESRNYAGVFAFDIDKEDFYEFSAKVYVPIVLIDSILDDPLFFQVYDDYQTTIAEAKKILNDEHPYLIIDKFYNQQFVNFIEEGFLPDDIYTYSNYLTLEAFMKDKQGRNGIVLSESLALMASTLVSPTSLLAICYNNTQLPPELRSIILDVDKKVEAAINVMHLAMAKTPDATHRRAII